jgi:hypothetical protein
LSDLPRRDKLWALTEKQPSGLLEFLPHQLLLLSQSKLKQKQVEASFPDLSQGLGALTRSVEAFCTANLNDYWPLLSSSSVLDFLLSTAIRVS